MLLWKDGKIITHQYYINSLINIPCSIGLLDYTYGSKAAGRDKWSQEAQNYCAGETNIDLQQGKRSKICRMDSLDRVTLGLRVSHMPEEVKCHSTCHVVLFSLS